MIPLAAIAAASLAAWMLLVLRRGWFWRADVRLDPGKARPPEPPPKVVAIIPARDEAETIGATVASLLLQDYRALAAVVVVDDNSSDGTAEAARAVARHDSRLRVVKGQPLPEGWSGKVWAMAQGVDAAAEAVPDGDYLLLTDADIEHERAALSHLVAKAESEGRDMVSLMVRLSTEGAWARLLIPAFVFFFQKLYPFPWVNDPARPTAAAAGGCMLVYRRALEAAGGMAAIRDRLIDDCSLAALLKRRGRLWLGLSDASRSLRQYRGLGDVWTMVARTAFEQLGYSLPAVLASAVGMLLLYVAPPVGFVAAVLTVDSTAIAMFLLAWGLMTFAYLPTLRYHGEPAWRALLLPFAAVLYVLMTIDSARRALLGRGGGWKGRAYPRQGKP